MILLDEIKNIINKSVDNGAVSFGAVIATHDRDEVINYFYGLQDIENNIPYSDKTIIRAFSCTKTFTAVAVFKCLELGLFKIDDPISKYFSSFKNPKVNVKNHSCPAKREIIIKDLLDMKAGFTYPNQDNETGKYLQEIDCLITNNKLSTLDFAEQLGSSPLLFSPGDDYCYSCCADILGSLIVKTSGMSLQSFYKKYIFDPAGLKETDFFVDESNKTRIAKGYITRNNRLEPINHSVLGISTTGVQNKFESGGAGLFMTLNDLNNWAQCLLNKTSGILSEETFNKMINPEFSINSAKMDNGYSYYNLMRHMLRPNECSQECSLNEFGWDGMLGTFLMVDSINKITYVAAFQSFDETKWELIWKLKDIIFKYYKKK